MNFPWPPGHKKERREPPTQGRSTSHLNPTRKEAATFIFRNLVAMMQWSGLRCSLNYPSSPSIPPHRPRGRPGAPTGHTPVADTVASESRVPGWFSGVGGSHLPRRALPKSCSCMPTGREQERASLPDHAKGKDPHATEPPRAPANENGVCAGAESLSKADHGA